MMNIKRALGWYLLAVAVIVLDQLTKHWAVAGLQYGHPLEITPFFNLTLAHNTGAAFSFLSDAGGWQRWLFTALAVGVSAVLVIWLARTPDRFLSAALALVLGGALGNLYDRVTLGYVVDFADFHWGGWHFPAFNIADSAITCGAILLLWESLFQQRKKKPGAAANE